LDHCLQPFLAGAQFLLRAFPCRDVTPDASRRDRVSLFVELAGDVAFDVHAAAVACTEDRLDAFALRALAAVGGRAPRAYAPGKGEGHARVRLAGARRKRFRVEDVEHRHRAQLRLVILKRAKPRAVGEGEAALTVDALDQIVRVLEQIAIPLLAGAETL